MLSPDVSMYRVEMFDRRSMYADLMIVALTLLDYLAWDDFKTPEIKGIEQETAAALSAVVKCCAIASTNLEANTRVSEDIIKRVRGGV